MKRSTSQTTLAPEIVDTSKALVAIKSAAEPMALHPLGELVRWEAVKALKTDEDYQDATVAGQAISRELDEIEAKRLEMVGDTKTPGTLNFFIHKLNCRAKAERGPFESVRDHIKKLIAGWHDAQMLKQVAAAEKQAAKVSKDSPQAASEILALATRANPTPAAGVRMGKRIYGTISDFAKVPDAFKVLDQKKVDAALKAGLEIPGIEKHEETTVALSGGQDY